MWSLRQWFFVVVPSTMLFFSSSLGFQAFYAKNIKCIIDKSIFCINSHRFNSCCCWIHSGRVEIISQRICCSSPLNLFWFGNLSKAFPYSFSNIQSFLSWLSPNTTMIKGDHRFVLYLHLKVGDRRNEHMHPRVQEAMTSADRIIRWLITLSEAEESRWSLSLAWWFYEYNYHISIHYVLSRNRAVKEALTHLVPSSSWGPWLCGSVWIETTRRPSEFHREWIILI